jgi:septal ring factor EnvC (AmiA/AmiB activator)
MNEEELLKREKTFIDRIGWSTVLTILAMGISIATTFAVAQYKINELQIISGDFQKQLNELKKEKASDSKSLTVVETEIKTLNASISELKDQNKETYRLLLDMSRR